MNGTQIGKFMKNAFTYCGMPKGTSAEVMLNSEKLSRHLHPLLSYVGLKASVSQAGS